MRASNPISLRSALIFCSLLSLSACDLFQFKDKDNSSEYANDQPLARVGQQFLYPRDVQGIVPKGVASEDSINIMERHIKSWIKKQLLISEAKKQFAFDEAELERRVLDYKYALMIHEFEKYNVSRRLDMYITEEEIDVYYKENIDNFELKQNIIRGVFIQISKDAPKLSTLRTLLRSSREADKEELKSYAYSYGTKVHLNDSVWVNFEDVISNTPLVDIPNKTEFLKRNNYYEIPDGNYIYILKIAQYKIQSDISPLEFVRDDIEKIILNKRKVKLAKELEEEIYDKAVKDGSFKIFRKS